MCPGGVGIKSGVGQLPLQNQGRLTVLGEAGSKFSTPSLCGEPKSLPQLAASVPLQGSTILVPRAEPMAIPDLVLPVPLSHQPRDLEPAH